MTVQTSGRTPFGVERFPLLDRSVIDQEENALFGYVSSDFKCSVHCFELYPVLLKMVIISTAVLKKKAV